MATRDEHSAPIADRGITRSEAFAGEALRDLFGRPDAAPGIPRHLFWTFGRAVQVALPARN